MHKLAKLTYLVPFILLLSVSVIGQVGYSSNIGTSLSGGGGSSGGGVIAGACAAGQFMTVIGASAPTCTNASAFGTLTANNPFTFTQTWNNAAVVFDAVRITTTETAKDAWSAGFQVFGGTAGTTSEFCVGPCGNATQPNVMVRTSSGDFVSNLPFVLHNGMTIDNGRFFCYVSAGCFRYKSAGNFSIDNNNSVDATEINVNGATINSFGTGAAISGNASVGRITVGTSPAGTGTISFTTSYETNAPHCDAINETKTTVIPVVATTSGATFTGTFAASDLVSYHCTGWHAQ